jgi:hypothetical protein
MQFKNRVARLEVHQAGSEEIGPIIVHFVSPVRGEDYGKGYASFPGTALPNIWRTEGESLDQFTARAGQIWNDKNVKKHDGSEVL